MAFNNGMQDVSPKIRNEIVCCVFANSPSPYQIIRNRIWVENVDEYTAT